MDIQQAHACEHCDSNATWACVSGISGAHFFCEVHARAQPNFGGTTAYYSWLRVYSPEQATAMPPKQHPTAVERYDGTLEEMAIDTLRMRYDSVSEFFGYCLKETHRQSASDFIHGKPQLSAELEEAALTLLELRERFARIYRLCRPYMPGAP